MNIHRKWGAFKQKAVTAVAVVAGLGIGFLLGVQWDGTSEFANTGERLLNTAKAEESGAGLTNAMDETSISLQTVPLSSYYGVTYALLERDLGERELSLPMPHYFEFSDHNIMIHRSIISAHRWIPDRFYDAHIYMPLVTYQSEQYFSTELFFQFTGEKVFSYSFCTVFDLATGDVLYLDDFVEVEKLAELMSTGVSVHHLLYAPEPHYVAARGALSEAYTLDIIKERLVMCSVPYGDTNYRGKPTFYLGPGRLYFANVLNAVPNHEPHFYVELDDIEHLLKVDRW